MKEEEEGKTVDNGYDKERDEENEEGLNRLFHK